MKSKEKNVFSFLILPWLQRENVISIDSDLIFVLVSWFQNCMKVAFHAFETIRCNLLAKFIVNFFVAFLLQTNTE